MFYGSNFEIIRIPVYFTARVVGELSQPFRPITDSSEGSCQTGPLGVRPHPGEEQ